VSSLTYDQRVRALSLSLDMCQDCARDLDIYAKSRGMDVFVVIRELLWKSWGHWSHGHGCPPPLPVQAISHDNPESSERAPAAAPAVAGARSVVLVAERQPTTTSE